MSTQIPASYHENFYITKEMVKKFGDAVNDHNPLHFDEQYAKTTRFGRPIVHGAFLGGLVSGMFVEAYGQGTIYVSISLEFIRPVFVDSHVKIILKPSKKDPQSKFTRIRIAITDENDQSVVFGLAEIIPGEAKNGNTALV